jgi:hypothetical protein
MGYTTEFEGSFQLDRELDDDTYNLLTGLATTRRMKRSEYTLREAYPDKDFGIEGEFYCEDTANFGQDDRLGVSNYNEPPCTQPSLWLQWTPSSDRKEIGWDGNEKFYGYVEWLKYIINKILKPRGYKLNGEVEWYGEERTDIGIIQVNDNVVTIKEGKVTFD